MKTVSVADAQAKLTLLLKGVAAGEEIDLVDGQKVVARLVPPEPDLPRVDWTSTWTRVAEVFGKGYAPGTPGSEIVTHGRR